MWKWIKDIFKPYQGSSEHFTYLYQYAKDELSMEEWNPDTVLKILVSLVSFMKTHGDARLVREIQDEFSLKMRSFGEERS